jgi:quinol monooxygenase YgiN
LVGDHAVMLIIAGELHVDPADRDRYLAAAAGVAPQARSFPGCLDFVQAADPVDPGRINVYERWESDEDLLRFRGSGGPELDLPELLAADVHKYRIAAVEAP